MIVHSDTMAGQRGEGSAGLPTKSAWREIRLNPPKKLNAGLFHVKQYQQADNAGACQRRRDTPPHHAEGMSST